jgi:hypothetical protein
MSVSYYSGFHPSGGSGAKGSAAFLPTLSSASVYLYRRSSTTLTSSDKPNGDVVYTFSTGNTDTSAITNGWTASFPSGTDDLYIVYAIATGEEATDTITSTEWSIPVVFVRNGLDGGPSGNFILDSVTGEGWVYSNAEYSPSSTGTNIYERNRAVFLGEGTIWFVGDTLEQLERTAVTPGQTYYMSLWLYKSSAATGDISGRVELYDASGAYIEVQDVPGITTTGASTNTWFQRSGQWPCPEGVAYVRPLAGNNTGGTSNTIFVSMPFFGAQQLGADVTATAQRTIEPQFPVIEIHEGEAGNIGTRSVAHIAKRGTSVITGGTWSLTSVNLGAGSAIVSSSTGTVDLSGIVQSGAYSIRYTHTDGVATELAVNVSFIPNVLAGVGTFASSITKNFSTSSFVSISNPLTIALPTGVTSAGLLAVNILLEVDNAFPAGSTNCEVKWQRESSPGVWSDVGTAEASSPSPGIIDEGGFPSPTFGSVTCNRTATGLAAGSNQAFRLVARITSGNIRTVTTFGTVSAGG